MNNQTVGKTGEDIAARYLEATGYTVLCRNYRSAHLETDIVCENETHILFVEVKSRTDTGKLSKYGRPGTAVDHKKRQNLRLCAEEYLRQHKPNKKPRIDVIEVYLKKTAAGYVLSEKGLKHIENALL